MMEDEDEHAGTKLGRKKTQLVFHHIYIYVHSTRRK
jgi:hypothetical protein